MLNSALTKFGGTPVDETDFLDVLLHLSEDLIILQQLLASFELPHMSAIYIHYT